MNKKLTNILRTNVTLYFICLVLFALAAIPFDVRLAIGEGAAAVVLLIIARRRSRSVQQSMRQYMDRFTGGMDSARSSNMLFAPLPMMVFDMDTQAVVWCNDGFLALTEQKEGVFDAHLNAVVPTFSVRWLMEGKNECPEHVVWNHRIYRVYGGLTRPTPDTPATMATTYWMDVTDSEQLRQTLQMTRPVVAILMVDNYEDLMKACPESKRSAVLAQLEEKLDQWSAGADGLMLHYDRDRYLFVFEERSYSDYAQHRFAVLDTVREVAAGGVAATLSIGVGRDADSFDALFKNASLALEMALSRGGDQAVVKDRLNFQFYGGRAKSTEKRTKVKSRVMANALGELMDDARQVYVMGHSYADMDSLGAAAGVCCIAKKDIVVDDIVLLEQGEEIPADGILLEAISLQVNESSLTGEPIANKTVIESEFNLEATYPSNHVMRGTTVSDGHGIMQVLAVGDATEFGKVAEKSSEKSEEPTPLDKQLDSLAKFIGHSIKRSIVRHRNHLLPTNHSRQEAKEFEAVDYTNSHSDTYIYPFHSYKPPNRQENTPQSPDLNR